LLHSAIGAAWAGRRTPHECATRRAAPLERSSACRRRRRGLRARPPSSFQCASLARLDSAPQRCLSWMRLPNRLPGQTRGPRPQRYRHRSLTVIVQLLAERQSTVRSARSPKLWVAKSRDLASTATQPPDGGSRDTGVVATSSWEDRSRRPTRRLPPASRCQAEASGIAVLSVRTPMQILAAPTAMGSSLAARIARRRREAARRRRRCEPGTNLRNEAQGSRPIPVDTPSTTRQCARTDRRKP
jgi:hypothetical protein